MKKYLKNFFFFLVVKFSVYLNRHVCVMIPFTTTSLRTWRSIFHDTRMSSMIQRKIKINTALRWSTRRRFTADTWHLTFILAAVKSNKIYNGSFIAKRGVIQIRKLVTSIDSDYYGKLIECYPVSIHVYTAAPTFMSITRMFSQAETNTKQYENSVLLKDTTLCASWGRTRLLSILNPTLYNCITALYKAERFYLINKQNVQDPVRRGMKCR